MTEEKQQHANPLPRGHHNPAPFREHPFSAPLTRKVRGFVQRVVDADTIDVVLEIWDHIHITERVRVKDYDADEIFGPKRNEEGQRAFERAKQLLPVGQPILVAVYVGKVTLQRIVADIAIASQDRLEDYATVMIHEGHVKK